MILVDYSPVIAAAAFQSFTGRNAVPMNIETLRHMTLNSLKFYRKNFKKEYGELILCVDSGNSWRKQVFPFYKARRHDARAESPLDWETFYQHMGTIENEIREFLPYKVVRVPACEADDIIAVLAKRLAGVNPFDRTLIISGDKDFRQLQDLGTVDQWSNLQKKFIQEPNPKLYLKEHTIRGDAGDGIPNMLSDDDSFVSRKRQKVMTAKRFDYYMETPVESYTESEKRGYYRNKMLVDLMNEIPTEQVDHINKVFDETPVAPSNRVLTYFSKNRLRQHMEEIQDFIK